MAATTTRTMALTVRRPFARTATLVIIRMPARRMVTGGRATSRTACLLEWARGTDGDTVTDSTDAAGMVMGIMVAADTDADIMAAGSLGIEVALPTTAGAIAALPEAAGSTVAVDSMAVAEVDSTAVAVAAASTAVAVDSMAVAVDSMAVAAAGTAVVTGN